MTVIAIQRLLIHEGPNIFGPQPGVALRVQCDNNHGPAIKHALKDGAQFIGLILAYLEVESRELADSWLIEARFTTPNPALGAELARYVVDGVRATVTQDESWDRDTPLFELQKRRRRESSPLATLQLVAEARRRGIPVLPLADGRLQFGYGRQSWAFDPQATPAAPPPWEQLGPITIYAVTGEQQRNQLAEQLAERLRELGRQPRLLLDADFAAVRRLLADPELECAVLSLVSDDLIQRGLPFEICELALISDCSGPRPAAASNDEEWLRALGLPMLIGRGPLLLNPDDPRLAALADYAPHGSLELARLETVLTQNQ